MPYSHTLETLEKLAIRSSLRFLESLCSSLHYDSGNEAERVRSACVSSIHWILRQRLVEELLKSGHLYDTVQLRVLEVLLHSDLRRLAVRHVRRCYRARFLQLLASGQASGLHVLLLEDMAWFTGSSVISAPLASAMRSLPHLRQVSLRFICDNDILCSLGTSCPFLQEIDISGSTQVTDVGMLKLCIEERIWSASTGSASTCAGTCINGIKWVLLSWFLEEALNLNNSLPLWWRESVLKLSWKTPCCLSLRYVNLTATQVSFWGVKLFKSCAPRAKISLPNGVDS